MTEHDTALAFDRALDGEQGISLNGSESLVLTSHALQTLFDRQQAAPSEHFITQLEQQIFAAPVIPPVIPSEVEGPHTLPVILSEVEGSPAAAVSRPQPTPRPAPIHPKRTRALHRWAAIAAALILLIGGAGAIVLGPFDLRSTPEPSAIPAIGFGTVEASPESGGGIWTVSPPQGVQGSSGPAFIEDGLMYSIFTGPSGPYAQVIDIETGQALWSSRLAVSADLTASVWRGLLLFTGTGGPNYELFAFDGRTGRERWSIPFTQRPVNLIVDGDRAFVLGSGNLVVAIDLETQLELWHADLSAFDPDWEPYGGMNRYGYFNDGRLALTNGVLAVLISDGRLIGLDADNGSEEWTTGHADDGRATVYAIAGQFAVTAEGKSIFDMDDDPYLQPPSPVPSYDPKTQPCERTIEPLSATDSSALGDYETSATGLDPTTGDPSWKVRTHAAVWIMAPDDTRLVAIIRPGWDSAIGNEDFAIYCSIDGETGDVARISDVELTTFTYSVGQTDEPWGMGIVSSGMPFGTGHVSPDVVKDLPHLELDLETFTGFRWVQEADGMILITEQDGTIIGFPTNASNNTSVDATPATPVENSANLAWVVPGSQGDHTESQITNPVVDNGRIFQSFYDVTPAYHTRAVDMATGKVLWDVPLDVRGEVMASYDDLLLVGGRVGALSKNFSLVALDQTTGEEVWRATLSDFPAAIAVDGDRAYVLGANDQLDAVDLTSGASIYTSDIGGDLEPHASYPTLGSRYRLAIDGDRLVAVLADGTVAGVDIESGAGIWWNLLSWSRAVHVAYFDGAIVVGEYGDMSDDPAEGDLAGTPEAATPIASGTPVPASCRAALYPATPVADSERDESPMVGSTYSRLDPATGRILWSVESTEQIYGQFVNGVGVVYVVTTAVDWPTDSSQIALCAIDPSNGQSVEIERLSDLGGSPFLMTSTSDGVQRESAGVDMGDGQLFGAPAVLDPARTGPKVTIDFDAKGGTSWLGIYDDAMYLSRLDGSLQKIPIPKQ